MSQDRSITVFAPAKINLYLHIAGKRDDGYHDIESLAVFTDIGDRITIEPADQYSLKIIGPFARSFTVQDSGPSNLVTRAIHNVAKAVNKEPDFRVTLTKNLPLAAGIGGGSADAAATIWGIMSLWNIGIAAPWLPAAMRGLGADVPVCLRCAPVRMAGIGDQLTPVPNLPETPVLLINPLKHCPTPDTFRRFNGPIQKPIPVPLHLSDFHSMIDFLKYTSNALTEAAIGIVPEISIALRQVAEQEGCVLSRMSGSGATVFGLFEKMDDAHHAAEILTLANPGWWVRVGTINSPARY